MSDQTHELRTAFREGAWWQYNKGEAWGDTHAEGLARYPHPPMTLAVRKRIATASPEISADFGYHDPCGCFVWDEGGASFCWRHGIMERALSAGLRALRWLFGGAA